MLRALAQFQIMPMRPERARRRATMRWTTSVGTLVLAVMLQAPLPSTALGGVPTEQLRGCVDRFLRVAADTSGGKRERRTALRRIADDIFDWEETAKRSLGTHWQDRTPVEREEFVRLFADLLERSYMTKIEAYDGERIGYLGDSVDGDQAIVRTKLVTKNGETGVNYRMRRRDDKWKVYDVEIEGVSLVSNYRTQFNRLLTRSAYPEVVRALKAKTTEPETEAVAVSPRPR